MRTAIATVTDIDPTDIGIDNAEQTVLPGGRLPEYVPREADAQLRNAMRDALDDDHKWVLVAVGPSKTGKSRALFEALRHYAEQSTLDLIAPADAAALQSLVTAGQGTEPSPTPTVLWLDDLEPLVNEGITFQKLREWRNTATPYARLVAATLGGKGSEVVMGSASNTLAMLTDQILEHAREIAVPETEPEELVPLRSRLSAEVLASIERHELI